MKTRTLMVCSHPDDETIFGYTALTDPNRACHVICCTNSDHPRRLLEFKNVMQNCYAGFGHTWEMWDFKDEWDGGFPEVAGYAILKVFNEGNFDEVLTHNESGDYGHRQHVALHKLVWAATRGKMKVFGKAGKCTLSFEQLQHKLQTLDCYKSQTDLNGFDWKDEKDPENTMMNWICNEHHQEYRF